MSIDDQGEMLLRDILEGYKGNREYVLNQLQKGGFYYSCICTRFEIENPKIVSINSSLIEIDSRTKRIRFKKNHLSIRQY